MTISELNHYDHELMASWIVGEKIQNSTAAIRGMLSEAHLGTDWNLFTIVLDAKLKSLHVLGALPEFHDVGKRIDSLENEKIGTHLKIIVGSILSSLR